MARRRSAADLPLVVAHEEIVDRFEGDKFLENALYLLPVKRSYEQILTIKSYLSTVDFFKVRSNTTRVVQFDDLCQSIRIERFEPGKWVIKKGDFADKVFIVFTGRCIVVDSTQKDWDKHKGYAQTLFRGMIFGEEAVSTHKPQPMCVLNDSHSVVELLSIEKGSYLKFLSDAYDVNKQPPPDDEVPGALSTNAQIIRILDKPRLLRTSADIELVSAHLSRSIPYFRQFKTDQMRELCRIVNTATFWDEKVLFKQGQRSEAFFAVLSGYVDIWCDRGDVSEKVTSSSAAAENRFGGLYLGKRENTLVSGITFGERSIETADSIRLSSVVTGDGLTQLIVVPRDAYLELAAFLRSSSDMDKVAILRQTNVFRQLEAAHLRNFANIMRPIIFKIGDHIYKEGRTPASDLERGITVIASGECFVEADIQLEQPNGQNHGDEPNLAATERRTMVVQMRPFASAQAHSPAPLRKITTESVNLGRIGPGGILYHFNVLSTEYEEYGPAHHTETVLATTPVHAYEISRSDFYHLPADTKQLITKEIAEDKYATLTMDEEAWRKNTAWSYFRRSIAGGKKLREAEGSNGHSNIIDSYRLLEKMRYTENNHQPLLQAPTAHSVVLGMRSDGTAWKEGEFDYDMDFFKKSLMRVGSAAALKTLAPPVGKFEALGATGLPSLDTNPRMSSQAFKAIQRNKLRTISKKHNLAFVQQVVDTKVHQSEQPFNIDVSNPERFRKQNPDEDLESMPFSLVHLHVENISSSVGGGSAGTGSRGGPFGRQLAGMEKLGGRRERGMQCHIRLSGTMPTSTQARQCASAQVQHAILSSSSRARGHHRSEHFPPEASVSSAAGSADASAGMPASGASGAKRGGEPPLSWKQFVGFDSMPLQHTDYFFLYCRNAPTEFACFTPDAALGLDFLRLTYPFACKSTGQNFAVFTARAIPGAVQHPTPGPESSSAAEDLPTARSRAASATEKRPIRGQHYTALSFRAQPSDAPTSGFDGTVAFLERSYAAKVKANTGTASLLARPPVVGGTTGAGATPDAARAPAPSPIIVPNEGRSPSFSRQQQRRRRSGLQKAVVDEDASDGEYDSDVSAADFGNSEAMGTVSMSSPASRGTTAAAPPGSGQQKGRQPQKKLVMPLLLHEMKVFGETLATHMSMADCLRFASSVSLPSLAAAYGLDVSAQSQLHVCAAALYEWHLLTENSLHELDVRGKLAPSALALLSSATGAIPSFGPTIALPNKHRKHWETGTSAGTGAGTSTRNWRSRPQTADGGFASTSGRGGVGGQPSSGNNHSNNNNSDGGSGSDSALVALHAMIEARREIIQTNDRICAMEEQEAAMKEKEKRRPAADATIGPRSVRDRLSSAPDGRRASRAFPAIPSPIPQTSAPRQAVNKQQLKLLEALINTVPTRTVMGDGGLH